MASDPIAEKNESKTTVTDQSPVPKSESSTGIDPPEKLDLRISMDGISSKIASVIGNLTKPPQPVSKVKTFLKDYLPALTPIATAMIAGMVSFYIYQSDHDRSKEALDKILSEFGQTTDDRARAIAAIKLADYGERRWGR